MPGRERIVVAMSGGVDSSTAAALLHASGAEVVGVTLKLYDATGTAASLGGRCCGPRDIEDARATAAVLGFPHYVLDETALFSRAVIDEFVADHRSGRTPNPCVRCNERLKFGPLLRFAQAVGATALATGHYARLDRPQGRLRLRRALDRDKDQAYFLFAVRPDWLGQVRFPLGDLGKPEVRALARRLALPNSDKPDSQQLCFIPDGDHRRYVEERGGAGPAGLVLDEQGASLGPHAGTHHFTVGQRRGLPGGAGGRRFVVRIDPATGTVHTGPREQLGCQSLLVEDVRWLVDPGVGQGKAQIQIRHHAAGHAGRVISTGPGTARVELDQPVEGVAPGQAAVFFRDDEVLGGGWIAAQPPARPDLPAGNTPSIAV